MSKTGNRLGNRDDYTYLTVLKIPGSRSNLPPFSNNPIFFKHFEKELENSSVLIRTIVDPGRGKNSKCRPKNQVDPMVDLKIRSTQMVNPQKFISYSSFY